MRYSPLETETALFDDMSSVERMHYATTRMVESEEVWSLGDEQGWLIRDVDGCQLISIWPYRQLAQEHGTGGTQSATPQAISLEHFVFNVLELCEGDDIWLEVFPTASQTGHRMRATDLHEILGGMLETNEYFIEG